MHDFQKILNFWFHPEDHPDYGTARVEWFRKDPKFDAEIKQNFLFLYVKAKEGQLLQWTENRQGCLALILLFDQFSRNMFRDSPDAFQTDGKAREIARLVLSNGFFNDYKPLEKTFIVLPLEHSENMPDQKKSVELFKSFGNENEITYAERHYDVIAKFDRFPHRNEVLSRVSSEDEITFLSGPNSSF
ncbi:MAG: DUF924 domain-containing protein [Sneathiella sp.]|nr:DUF924 domain-containing protein [Sneathiella sp.]